MVKLNCNNFRAFIKCLEPVGDELIFQFEPERITVAAMGTGASQLLRATMDMPTGYQGKLGLSLEMVKKLLPKEIAEVDVEFGTETKLTGVGFKSKIAAINEVSCLSVPKKEVVPNPGTIRLNAQKVYERLTALKAAFDSTAFDITLDPLQPTLVTFSDSDSSVGSMSNSVITDSPVTMRDSQILPYDVVLPALNAVRNQTDFVEFKFMDMPSDKDCRALVIEGVVNIPDSRIAFQYVVAPRVKDA